MTTLLQPRCKNEPQHIQYTEQAVEGYEHDVMEEDLYRRMAFRKTATCWVWRRQNYRKTRSSSVRSEDDSWYEICWCRHLRWQSTGDDYADDDVDDDNECCGLKCTCIVLRHRLSTAVGLRHVHTVHGLEEQGKSAADCQQ